MGRACPNLQKCEILSTIVSLPEAEFRGLFVEPKHKLKDIHVHTSDTESITSILSVLADDECLLESFSVKGRCSPPPPCPFCAALFNGKLN